MNQTRIALSGHKITSSTPNMLKHADGVFKCIENCGKSECTAMNIALYQQRRLPLASGRLQHVVLHNYPAASSYPPPHPRPLCTSVACQTPPIDHLDN
ncbi:unnamed protein product [Mesocestoides corti]|uniref:Uncharacterized protein n=1 Tax=Mesocestoides corti TaxID=53468 RepID=A0A0R3UA80_MESCO|nr:unnamed protein product [Mesocestoides corti]